jgi:Sec-independent protein translocase protein TatA
MTPFWTHLVIVIVVAFLLFWGPEGVIALFIF